MVPGQGHLGRHIHETPSSRVRDCIFWIDTFWTHVRTQGRFVGHDQTALETHVRVRGGVRHRRRVRAPILAMFFPIERHFFLTLL